MIWQTYHGCCRGECYRILAYHCVVLCWFTVQWLYNYCIMAYHCVGKAGSSRVGDGGASWRLKALARAKQQASDSSDPNFGRRVGDIVSEQWGSLAELTAGLTHTRAAHGG